MDRRQSVVLLARHDESGHRHVSQAVENRSSIDQHRPYGRDEATAIPAEELIGQIGREFWLSAPSFGCEQPRHDRAACHLVERADRQELREERRPDPLERGTPLGRRVEQHHSTYARRREQRNSWRNEPAPRGADDDNRRANLARVQHLNSRLRALVHGEATPRTKAQSVAGRVERKRPPTRFTQGGNLMAPHAVISKQTGPEQRSGLARFTSVINVERAENRVYGCHGSGLLARLPTLVCAWVQSIRSLPINEKLRGMAAENPH